MESTHTTNRFLIFAEPTALKRIDGSGSLVPFVVQTEKKRPARRRLPPLSNVATSPSSAQNMTSRTDVGQGTKLAGSPGHRQSLCVHSHSQKNHDGSAEGEGTSPSASLPITRVACPYSALHYLYVPMRATPPPVLNAYRRVPIAPRASTQRDPSEMAAGRSIAGVVKDYEMLARAGERAGNVRVAAAAMYNLGVIMDNNCMYAKAMSLYSKLLALAVRLDDHHLQCLAHNSIGVDYQLMIPEEQSNLENALHHHQHHLDLSADDANRVVAHYNIALVLDVLGQVRDSIIHLQSALQAALRQRGVNSAMPIELMSCAHMGIIALREGDYAASKAFLERYLTLTRSAADRKLQGLAYLLLGRLYASLGHREAVHCFEKASQAAKTSGDRDLQVKAETEAGVAQGTLRMNQYVHAVSYMEQLL
mmetsp:Transcript_626/g.1093  ORF Transcript_626/g.1093 Transcript_626/m.1093 type:complete len:421 (+) Transcript_626:111-1373(+)